ncbi:PrgI family protein [Candidatus Saccharibacteria bacterium]|nr:PrgI family protein [Candidatus Saccharibacteria bacterium]
MSVYKVPQDVEADDKLLGPFNFRQFIYLIIVAGCIALDIFLWGIFPGLIILPLPVIIFFGALALPLRKDQPMETYLAAVVSFYLKPNKRFWQPDGVEHLIQISAPENKEESLTKDISQNEASRRLSYLADIIDTEGWAIKHSIAPVNTTVREEYSNEARTAEDMFDNSRISSNVDSLLSQHDSRRKQQIMQNLDMARNLAQFTNENSENIQDETYYFDPRHRYEGSDNIKFEDIQVLSSTQTQPTSFSQNQPQIKNEAFSNNWQTQPQQNFDENIQLNYNPYPDSINQKVISPNWQQNQPQVQQFTQPSPQPLSNFTPLAPQPVQQQEISQNNSKNPPDNFSQNLEGINNSFERIKQINETVEREKRDPKIRISTNPENNPFINRKHFTEKESVKEISAEMKRLVSEGKDLSVETLARQANRLADKEKKSQENSKEVDLGEKEVIISLR